MTTASILGPRGSYSVQAGAFRHRVTIQAQGATADSAGGLVAGWVSLYPSIAAAVEDIAGDEKDAGQAITGITTTAISIRWRPNIDTTMRVLHTPKGEHQRIYNIDYIQRDPTQRKTMTLYCSRYDNQGLRADGQ